MGQGVDQGDLPVVGTWGGGGRDRAGPGSDGGLCLEYLQQGEGGRHHPRRCGCQARQQTQSGGGGRLRQEQGGASQAADWGRLLHGRDPSQSAGEETEEASEESVSGTKIDRQGQIGFVIV